MNKKKTQVLIQIGICVSKSELKKIKETQRKATEPSLSNHCRNLLRESIR